MLTYLFYDLETSGLNFAFDQILQFAAIRTDLSLNEIERYSFELRLRPDVFINPHALITHKISSEELKNALCEYEGVHRIHSILNTAGTISCGYNSLKFDNEFLRFSFYRNLLPAYTHQFKNSCSTMDIFPITIFFCLFKPELLSWPKSAEGRLSLKLEDLAESNGLASLYSGRAHDALFDTEVCLALARILFKERDMWDYLVSGFSKKEDLSRIKKLPTLFNGLFSYGLACGPGLGPDSDYISCVLLLGFSEKYKNQSLWLRLDFNDMEEEVDLNLESFSYVIRKKNAEAPFLLPPKKRFLRLISEEKQELIKKNIAWLKKNMDFLSSLSTYHRSYEYPYIENLDIDAALYQNPFPSREEERLCELFHSFLFYKSDYKSAFELIDKFPASLKTQAIRLFYRNGLFLDKPLVKEEGIKQLNSLFSRDSSENLRDWRGKAKEGVFHILDELNLLLQSTDLSEEQSELLRELKAEIENHSEFTL